VAVAALLLFLVSRTVPWQDTVALRRAESGPSETYRGAIEGDWTSASIAFRFAAGQSVPEGSLLEGTPLAGAPRAGARVALTRSSLEGRGEQGQPERLEELRVEWHPGMPRAFRGLQPRGLAVAFLFLFLATLCVSTRWWRLLILSGCGTGWWNAFRLSYVGLFFNTVLPGSTGGDIARAYVVVRDHPERRARALMTVMVDRVLGLVAMALVASIAVYANDARFAHLRGWVLLALAAMVGGLTAVLHPTLRRWMRFDRILARLPQARRLGQLDAALREYAHHPREMALAILLSCANHLCATGAAFALGHAFGDGLSFHDYVCIVTIANTLTAVPISPGGLGVGEVLFGELFAVAGGMRLLGVATSFVYRLVLVAIGLFGGLFLLAPSGAAVRRELDDARPDAEGTEGGGGAH